MERRVHHGARARVERDLLLVGNEAAQLDAPFQPSRPRGLPQGILLRPPSGEDGAQLRPGEGERIEQQARPLVRLQAADPEDVVGEASRAQTARRRRRVVEGRALETVVAAEPIRHRLRVREDPLHLPQVGGVPALHGVANGHVLRDLRGEGRVFRPVEVVVEGPVLMEDPGHLAVGATSNPNSFVISSLVYGNPFFVSDTPASNSSRLLAGELQVT